jgi:acyl-coenzyme A thioesterase PaaI-like protein
MDEQAAISSIVVMQDRFLNIGAAYGDRERRLLELSAATRELINEITSTTGDPGPIAAATVLVQQAVALLSPGPHERTYFGAPSESGGPTTTFFDYSGFVGPLNPLSPPLTPELIDGVVVAHVSYDRQFEGPPGHVHGGLIAGAFDEVLGFAQITSGTPGMTGRLEIAYRSPTPLFTEVVYRGWLDHVSGRKVVTKGTLHAGDRLCAEATGLFIGFAPGKGLPGVFD